MTFRFPRGRLLVDGALPRPLLPPLASGAAVLLAADAPALLVPVARVYQALCHRFPILAVLTNYAPSTSMALVVAFAAVVALAMLDLGASASETQLVCPFCPSRS